MKRIDFLGVPGVGKTTLYYKLLQQRDDYEKWLTPPEAKILIAKKHVKANWRSAGELLRLLALQLPNRTLQKKLTENISDTLAGKAFQERLQEWMPFIELCSFSLADGSKPPYYRFLLAKWFLSLLNDVALIESADLKHQVLFDDSLSQRATGMMPWDRLSGEQQSRKYFSLMPPPVAVVYLRADPQLIADRLVKRKKVIAQHQDLSYHDLLERTKIAALIVEAGAETLHSRGIPVLMVDALLPIAEMVVETKKLLTKTSR